MENAEEDVPTLLVGRRFGSALSRLRMKSLASSLTPVQYRVWNTTLSLRHSSIKSPMVSERNGE